jgi:hypothetical protein
MDYPPQDVVRQLGSEFLGGAFEPWSMTNNEVAYLCNVGAWMEVNRDVKISNHLPENVIFGLIIIKKGG